MHERAVALWRRIPRTASGQSSRLLDRADGPLKRLRDEGESAASVAFDELMDVPTLIMPRRQIRAKFVEPVLHAWGLDLSQVGYLNLLKWRTKGDYGIRRL